MYRRGLRAELQAELACRRDVKDLDRYIRMSVSIDNLIRERGLSRSVLECSMNVPLSLLEFGEIAHSDPEPMQLGQAPLSVEERQRRLQQRLCLYCRESGHQRLT